jgi:hypothetical protein
VTIGLATLDHLQRAHKLVGNCGGSASDERGRPASEDSLPEALAALTPSEALVHECLLGAGVLLGALQPVCLPSR